MPFPDAKRVIYKKKPLTRVVCQLRYPPILRIDSEVPSAFQDCIRSDYPLYTEKVEFQQEIAAGPGVQVSPEMVKQLTRTSVTKNHEFCGEDGAWKINLTRTFLSISTSEYVRWEEFTKRFRSSYDGLLAIYKPPFFARIGLRYVDIFDRSKLGLKDVSWTDLLQPYFLGLISSSVGKSVRTCENVYEVNLSDGESMVRIITSLVQNMQSNEQCYIVDSDFHTFKRTPPDRTFERLDFLHQRATRLIRWIIQDRLHNAMEPQEI
jgi:uncharacterized protein (TIGR04255 family)